MKGLQLNSDEKQLLIESLLFTASVDVCAEHTVKQRVEMVKLAEKINDPSIRLNNVYLFEGNGAFEEVLSKDISKKFTNLPVHDIITDQ